MGQKKYREPVEFDVIQAAIQGDADSINQIIAYFQPYINACPFGLPETKQTSVP